MNLLKPQIIFITIVTVIATNFLGHAAQAETNYLPSIISYILQDDCRDIEAEANSFYISPQGSDSSDGQSPQTAWRTLAKIEQNATNFTPGTQILLQRNAVWKEALYLNDINGTAQNPIKFGTYCNGAKPVISGLKTIQGWTTFSPNLWQYHCESCPDDLNLLLLNNQPLAFARYPNLDQDNGGYVYTNAFLDTPSLRVTADSLSGKNWRGAELVMRNNSFVLDRLEIQEHISDTVLLSDENLTYDPRSHLNFVGYGFFIQNHIDAADVDGEWVWDPATKMITLFWSQGDPNSLGFTTTTQQDLLTIEGSRYLDFQDIAITGANDHNIYALRVNDINLNQVTSSLSTNGILFRYGSVNIHLNELVVENNVNRAVDLYFCDNCSVTNSQVQDTGMIAGLGRQGVGTHTAIEVLALNSESSILVEGNTVNGSGYNGISIGQRVTVRNNIVESYNSVKTDGGGIYIYNTDGEKNVIIEQNLVMNGAGTTAGMAGRHLEGSSETTETHGIYLDGASSNIIVRDNTVIRAGDDALFMNKTAGIEVTDNYFIDSLFSSIKYRDYADASGATLENPNQSINGNTLIQLNESPLISIDSETETYNLSGFGSIDNNTYCVPYGQSVFEFDRPGQLPLENYYGFARWIQTGFDTNSSDCALQLSKIVETFIGPELISNPDFSVDISDWNLRIDQGQMSHSNQLGGSLLVESDSTVDNETVNPFITLIGNEFNDGETYRVTLSAQSLHPQETPLELRLTSNSGTASNTVHRVVGSDASEYSADLTLFSSTNFARLWMTTDSHYLPLLFNRVSVKKIEGSEKSKDALLFITPNISALQKTVTLNANYIDLEGQTVLNGTKLTIEPFETLILLPL